jgi:nucleoside-diphosphate-sugar epimerase
MSARVLVTGASGFVGRPLVDALVGAGHRVRATTRQSGEARFPAGVETVATGDYRQPVDWAPLLAGVDSVVHLAGIAHVGPAIDEADYDRVVHAATAELAAACSKAGTRRFVVMSSVRAQSGPAADGVLTEDDAPRPTEAYGRAKLRAEAAVRAAGVPWTILRPTMVYGAGAKGNLARLLRVADSPWPLPLAGLANRRSLVSLDNLIAAVRFVLGADVAVRQVYLVADPTPVTLPQIIAALRRGLGRAPRLYPVPLAVFAHTCRLIGRGDVWERIGGSLVVDSGKLIAAGWRPDADTLGTLARIAGQHARALNA